MLGTLLLFFAVWILAEGSTKSYYPRSNQHNNGGLCSYLGGPCSANICHLPNTTPCHGHPLPTFKPPTPCHPPKHCKPHHSHSPQRIINTNSNVNGNTNYDLASVFNSLFAQLYGSQFGAQSQFQAGHPSKPCHSGSGRCGTSSAEPSGSFSTPQTNFPLSSISNTPLLGPEHEEGTSTSSFSQDNEDSPFVDEEARSVISGIVGSPNNHELAAGSDAIINTNSNVNKNFNELILSIYNKLFDLLYSSQSGLQFQTQTRNQQ